MLPIATKRLLEHRGEHRLSSCDRGARTKNIYRRGWGVLSPERVLHVMVDFRLCMKHPCSFRTIPRVVALMLLLIRGLKPDIDQPQSPNKKFLLFDNHDMWRK
jgi:hypothetical protein